MPDQFNSALMEMSNITDYIHNNILTLNIAIQIAVILTALAFSYLLRKIIVRAVYQLGRNHIQKIVKYQSQISELKAVLLPLLTSAILWATKFVFVDKGLEHQLIRIISILLMAWAIIRFISIFIASPRYSRIFEAVSWTTAALAILGWLTPFLNGVDSIGFAIGEVRLSVLSVTKAAILLTLFFWAAHHLNLTLQNQINKSTKLSSSLRVLLGKLIQFTLTGLAILLALSAVGIDLTAFAVFTGALGVGIGFGLQKIISNFISGIILLMDKSLKPGDVIEVETGSGVTYGWVEKLGLRYTSVTTRDGTETLIPNETFITNPVTNWSFSNSRVRRKLPIGVAYDTDVEKAMQLCIEATVDINRVLKQPAPVCQLRDFGDSSVNLELRFWIEDPADGIKNVESAVNLNIWKLFRANNIEIPFPQRVVHLQTDGPPLKVEIQQPKKPVKKPAKTREPNKQTKKDPLEKGPS